VDWTLLFATLGRGVLAYAVVVLYIRLSGNRTLAKMRAFDFVVTIALGTLLASTIVTNTTPLWQGLAAIGLLILLQYVVARLGVASPAFNRLVTNESIRVRDERGYDEKAMRRARVTRDEVEAAIRRAGLPDASLVKEVWLEVNGDLSVVKRS